MRYGEGGTLGYARALTFAPGRLAHAQADARGARRRRWSGHPPRPPRTSARRARAASRHPDRVRPAGVCPWDELFAICRGPNAAAVDSSSSRTCSTRAPTPTSPRREPPGPPPAAAEYAALGPHVVVVQLLHPDELEFPWRTADQLQFECLRGQHLTVETHVAAARDAYLASLREHLHTVDAAAARVHLPLLRVRTDAPMVETLPACSRRSLPVTPRPTPVRASRRPPRELPDPALLPGLIGLSRPIAAPFRSSPSAACALRRRPFRATAAARPRAAHAPRHPLFAVRLALLGLAPSPSRSPTSFTRRPSRCSANPTTPSCSPTSRPA